MPAPIINPRRLTPNKSVLSAPAMPGEYDGLTAIQRVKKRHTGDPESDLPIGIAGWKATTVDVAGRDVSLIANTDDIDMQREVVVPAGADPAYFTENRSVFLDHCYYWQNFVGKMRGLAPFPSPRNHKQWRVNVAILKLASNPVCDDILVVAEEWGLGASIGFEGLEGGPPTEDDFAAYPRKGQLSLEWVTRKWLWLELSITAMPCNVACNTAGERSEKTIAYLDDAVVKGRIKRASAVVLGLPTTPKRKLQPVFITD